MDLSTKILKNGIQNLLEDEDQAFKKSLSDCLSFKINEAINEVKESFLSMNPLLRNQTN